METLDKIDIKLLRLLQSNGRMTVKELADKVSLSTTPVFERVKRLEREGYILRYVALLDAAKLNRGFIVFCCVKLSTLNHDIAVNFVNTVRELDQVSECYNISGEYDYLLKIHAPDMKSYQEFILNVLGRIDNLGSITSMFVMDEIKISPLPI